MSKPVDCSHIAEAAQLLRDDQLVAFPTETVYGLGANALSETAVAKIFAAKGRPSDNPLIVHVHSLDAAREFVDHVDDISETLAKKYWPGPLTIILPLKSGSKIAKNVSAGLDTVGIRVPDHPVALALLKEAGLPLAAPSSNKSGSPSPTTAMHVYNDLIVGASGEKPAMILDGGNCRVGLESTVVHVRADCIHILRPGGVTAEDLSRTTGLPADRIRNAYAVKLTEADAPRAPGMKYRHYAPSAHVVAVDDMRCLESLEPDDVVICFDSVHELKGVRRLSFGASPEDVETASNRLFDLFRTADSYGAKRIFIDCSFARSEGLGAALWNRISKAANR